MANRRALDLNEHIRSEIRHSLQVRDRDVIPYADFEALKDIYHGIIGSEFNRQQKLLLDNGKLRDHPRFSKTLSRS